MSVKLKWNNINASAVTVNIYRDTTLIDRENLGTPIATLTNGEEEYLDATAAPGQTYYYVFETVGATDTVVSTNYKIKASVRRGPGPNELIYGNMEYGYFGTLGPTEFITAAALRAQVNLTYGVIHTATPTWHKYARNGKILYIPQGPLAYNVTWDQLYSLGLVYGTDNFGFGSFVPAVGVNQRTLCSIGPDDFIVRLMTGYSDDPSNIPSSSAVSEPTEPYLCEWHDLVYPLHRTVPDAQRMPNMADLTTTQLNITSSTYAIQMRERVSASQNLYRGLNNAARLGITYRYISGSGANSNTIGWWPVLELVENLIEV